ncbi:MAG: hypothetical protein Hyperionvirus11_28 [Hyperionvirus sp.]|uniref:Uncharacterized protein n=1 Tax=Hyperionvirus sp. TaxID=2487770 RepID=A0A3G5A945_9VIRU|nr:MAG: hypothetical protein Hyperionvirus11_28 [Hyperionvirus sp.]
MWKNLIDWKLVRENLPFGSRQELYHPSVNAELALKKYATITDYLESICKFVSNSPLPEDFSKIVAGGSYFAGDPNPTLDIVFVDVKPNAKQHGFWKFIMELLETFEDNLIYQGFNETPMKLIERKKGMKIDPDFIFWIKILFPTWEKVKHAIKIPHFWRHPLKIMISHYLGEYVPSGLRIRMELEPTNQTIAAPLLEIDNRLPNYFLPDNIRSYASILETHVRILYNHVQFKQACADHLIRRLLSISEPEEYDSLQMGMTGWASQTILEWLGSKASVNCDIDTLGCPITLKTQTDIDILPHAIACLLKELLAAAPIDAGDEDRRKRWYKPIATLTTIMVELGPTPATDTKIATAATIAASLRDSTVQPMTVLEDILLGTFSARDTCATIYRAIKEIKETVARRNADNMALTEAAPRIIPPQELTEDKLILKRITSRINEARAFTKSASYSKLSLYDINCLTAISSSRLISSDIMLKAILKLLTYAKYIKTVNIKTVANQYTILKQLTIELKEAPYFGTVELSNEKYGGLNVSRYTRPRSVSARQAMIHDRHILAMIMLRNILTPSINQLPPKILHAVLDRYQLPTCPDFLRRHLASSFAGHLELLWNRRRILFIMRFSKTTPNPISALPRALFEMLVHYL